MIRQLFALSLLALTCMIGCSKSDTTANVKEITLQLNWKPEPQFGGFYTADLAGAYAKHGLKVNVQPGGSGAPTIEMLGAGSVPFAVVSADEIPRARQQGIKIIALFAVYQTHPQGIMTRASRGLKDISDIFKTEGTLAMEKGLPYSDFLKAKYGFDKLKIVPCPFGDLTMYRADNQYAMQCFVTSEPLAAKTLGIEPKTFLIADSGFNPYATVLATTDDYLKNNRATVDAMIASVNDGWRAYLDHPEKTNEVMGKLNTTMDAQTFIDSAQAQKELIETSETKKNGLGYMSMERWQTLVDQLKELKVIDKPITPEECYLKR